MVHRAIRLGMSAAVFCVAREDTLATEMLAAEGEDLATIQCLDGLPLIPGIIATSDAGGAAATAAVAWTESEGRSAGEENEDTPAEQQICLGGARFAAALVGFDAGAGDVRAAAGLVKAREDERQARLVVEVFGNPFSPASIDPVWLTPTVTTLATVAYEDRQLPTGQLDTGRLAILADALEEAGCTTTEILSHLRSPGPHVRGCWALDLILDKE